MVHLNGYVIGFGPRAQKSELQTKQIAPSECTGGGGGVLPYRQDKTRQCFIWSLIQSYMGYISMCQCEGYGFQAVYSRIGNINQNIWV